MVNNNKMRFLLGIDGGGSKTEFLLTDLNGNEINRVVLGASNPVNVGLENTCKILKDGINQVCKEINLGEVSLFAGIAGGKTGNNNALVNNFLSDFCFGAFANGSDTDSVLQIALKGEDGVAIIMGTGIVAFTQCDGECYRTSGWGYMVDKGGSGFCFGSDALHSAFSCFDGSGGSNLIMELVENKLSKPLVDTVADIYSKGPSYVASFAPVVFEAYKEGDAEAEKIIDRNAHEAAKIINSARRFLKNNYGTTVICGGLSKQKEILKPFLLKYIQDDIPIIFSDEPTVNGAIALAKSNIQAGEKLC